MCPVVSADLPGYSQVKNQVISALDLCQESQSIEFKESATFSSIKSKLIRKIMAMGNLRDGGIIIIGVSQRNDEWDLKGINEDDLKTYDTDDVVDQINKYTSPPMMVDILKVRYRDEKEFLAIRVREFEDTPYVCKKDGTDLSKGYIYIRPPGKAQTKRVTDASELHQLLELAAEKRARNLLKTISRLGITPDSSDATNFDSELGDLHEE